MDKINYSRKDFLKLVGLGTVALTLPNVPLFADPMYKPKLGIQLYTVRKTLEKDFDGSVRKIAEIGYQGVETYPLPENVTLKHAAEVFKDAGLKIFSMHSELPVGKDRDFALKMADAYDCDTIIYHGWPSDNKFKPNRWPQDGRFQTMDETKHRIEMYDKVDDFLQTKGLRFGLHNHWWELKKTDFGIYPFYYMLEHLNKDVIFEIDTYWAKTAGQDPAKVVKDFGKRAPFLHIKDGPAVLGDPDDKKGPMYAHVPAGQGTLDFPAIVKAGGENIKWMIVEFDEYAKDIFDGIKGSYDYLTKNNLAEGKA
jgi:sugar phosphate isomerase/epimerase